MTETVIGEILIDVFLQHNDPSSFLIDTNIQRLSLLWEHSIT